MARPLQNDWVGKVFISTVDPEPGNDENDSLGVGYYAQAGLFWLNSITDELFQCLDPALGAAVWQGGTHYSTAMNDIGELTGFVDHLNSTLTWDDISRTLTLTPNPSYTYYFKGQKRVVSVGVKTFTIPNVVGFYLFWLDSDGLLQGSLAGVVPSPMTGNCLVAGIYWNGTKALGLGDERHGAVMDWATHAYFHYYFHAQYKSGFALAHHETVLTSQNGNAEHHAKFQLGDGEVADEDLEFSIEHKDVIESTDYMKQHLGKTVTVASYNAGTRVVTMVGNHSFKAGQVVTFFTSGGVLRGTDTVVADTTNSNEITLTTGIGALIGTDVLKTFAKIAVWYRTGASGIWDTKTYTEANNEFPFIPGTVYPRYNSFGGGVWGLSDIGNSNYVAVWVFGTDLQDTPIVAILGQREDTNLTNAQDNNTFESISWGEIPNPEFKLLYRVIVRGRGSYGNTVKAALQHITDYRFSALTPSANFNTAQHSGLSGLDYENAGHTGFGRIAWTSALAPTVDNDGVDTAGIGRSFRVHDYWLQTDAVSGRVILWYASSITAGAAQWQETSNTIYAAVAPTANNDRIDTAGLGRSCFAGYLWIDTVLNTIHICRVDTATAAVWEIFFVVPTGVDHAIVRYDGTNNIQGSLAFIDDSGNLSITNGDIQVGDTHPTGTEVDLGLSSGNDETVGIVSSRADGAGNISIALDSNVNAASIDVDHELINVGWIDNAGVRTPVFIFKSGGIESYNPSGAELWGTQADGGTAVAVKAGSENVFSTAGSKLLRAMNGPSSHAFDVGFDGQVDYCRVADGSLYRLARLSEEVTIAAAATTTSTIQIPAGCIVRAVSCRVTVAIPTATAFDIGISGATTRYGTALSVALGTEWHGMDNPGLYYNAATSILITPNGTPATDVGRLKIVIFYEQAIPPQS